MDPVNDGFLVVGDRGDDDLIALIVEVYVHPGAGPGGPGLTRELEPRAGDR